MNIAVLPGVGGTENPNLGHYRAAVRWLEEQIRKSPVRGMWLGGSWKPDPRIELLVALRATCRRLSWHEETRRLLARAA